MTVQAILGGERLQMEENAARALLSPEECRKFERNLRAIRDGRPSPNPTPNLETKMVRERSKDQVAGRDRRIDSWHQVLEYWGFKFYQPRELDRIFGMLEQDVHGVDAGEVVVLRIPHTVGEWRRSHGPRGLHRTFTTEDVVTLFETPFAFDRYMREEVVKWRRSHEGIKVVRR